MCSCVVFVLRLGDLLGGQADGVDLFGECDWPFHVQQRNVAVQIFPPVVLGVDDDFVDAHDLLNATLKPGTSARGTDLNLNMFLQQLLLLKQ